MGINSAFNENLRTWEFIDTDTRDANFLVCIHDIIPIHYNLIMYSHYNVHYTLYNVNRDIHTGHSTQEII
jgi:hypothetical protein